MSFERECERPVGAFIECSYLTPQSPNSALFFEVNQALVRAGKLDPIYQTIVSDNVRDDEDRILLQWTFGHQWVVAGRGLMTMISQQKGILPISLAEEVHNLLQELAAEREIPGVRDSFMSGVERRAILSPGVDVVHQTRLRDERPMVVLARRSIVPEEAAYTAFANLQTTFRRYEGALHVGYHRMLDHRILQPDTAFHK